MTATRRIDRFSERIKARCSALSARMQRVAHYIDQNRSVVLRKSALEIAKETDVSDATVIRTIQALGFEGLLDLKACLSEMLKHEQSPAVKMASTIDALQDDVDQAIDLVAQEQLHAISLLTETASRQAITNAVSILRPANRIGIFGIGASGLLATYAARLFSRNGYLSYALNSTGIALAEQLLWLSKGDVLIVLINGNTHREVLSAVNEARRHDIPIIVITGKPSQPLMRLSKQMVVLPRAKGDRIPLHGQTLVCLEMIMLGLVATEPARSMHSMDRLLMMRRDIRPTKR